MNHQDLITLLEEMIFDYTLLKLRGNHDLAIKRIEAMISLVSYIAREDFIKKTTDY
jgi:hypothetical protein